MSELVVLNPNEGYSADLGFNPNWSYGTKTDAADNMSYGDVRRGPALARETGCMGYSFDMTFTECTWAKIQWLKSFYNQFKTGYFTIIDWDGGGRYHSGRFITPPQSAHARNLIHTVQKMTFQDVQGARMLLYPSDWTHDSYFIYAVNDDLSPRVNVGTSGTFVPQQTPAAVTAGASVNDPTSYEMFYGCGDDVPANFAQVEYAGWGFQQLFRLGTNLGALDLYLDGVKLISSLSLYNGAAIATGPAVSAGNPNVTLTVTGGAGAGSVLVSVPGIPLDAHRVKVVALGTKTLASTGYSVLYPPLQVMY